MTAPVNRWQVITQDPAAHAAFYEQLFGWTSSADNAMAYHQVCTGAHGESLDGGFWPAPEGVPAFVQFYVQVEDVAATFALATAAGCAVIAPPQELPDGDSLALLKDPMGMSFGIHSAAG